MRTSTVLSSAAAPVLLIGGWTLAQSRQPAVFDPLHNTISDLAAHGAADRGIMTAALVGLGLCHLITAAGLTEAALPGRTLLGIGGTATVLVAAFPQPGDGGGSAAHTVAAATAFACLAAWPLAGQGATALLRKPAATAAGIGLLALTGWFALTLASGGPIGLTERIAAGAQAIWPFLVVQSVRRWGRP